ncbi:retinoic acid receptor RXR-beta-like isoform X3 [Lagopus leucura]|uniref:retinoic acid receptor RXR-beta-like isoform X3 n=1 Tax=Lagopus leucura TaxID=30410 RepID=UPI001C68414C|nr:retinoic acid receptor RXR-beta-like isoform X3 [Lagopus leucura]
MFEFYLPCTFADCAGLPDGRGIRDFAPVSEPEVCRSDRSSVPPPRAVGWFEGQSCNGGGCPGTAPTAGTRVGAAAGISRHSQLPPASANPIHYAMSRRGSASSSGTPLPSLLWGSQQPAPPGEPLPAPSRGGGRMKPVELQSPDPYLRSSVSRRCHLGSCRGPADDPQPERHEIGCRECRDGRSGAQLSLRFPPHRTAAGQPGGGTGGPGLPLSGEIPHPPSRLTGSS